jgi:uncharacterized membrane protein YhhN
MWRLLFVAVPAVLAGVAIRTSSVALKVSVAPACGLILLALMPGIFGSRAPALAVVAGMIVSAVGDYFMAVKGKNPGLFVAGIGCFLVAHVAYIVFALIEGRPGWIVLAVMLAGYLPFYFFALRPAIKDPTISVATLVYVLVSSFALSAAFGLRLPAGPRWLFVAGIAFIVVSDTVISLVEFLGKKRLEWLILPTYFLMHVLNTLSLLLWALA